MTCPILRKSDKQIFIVIQGNAPAPEPAVECEVLYSLDDAIAYANSWLRHYPVTAITEYRLGKGKKRWIRAEMYIMREKQWVKYHGIGMC